MAHNRKTHNKSNSFRGLESKKSPHTTNYVKTTTL
nr:MAG TPA_asm: hypothetical protein [Caudoviricetes sp.]